MKKEISLEVKKNFKDRLLRKATVFVVLLFFNFNIFSEVISDTLASIGTKVTKIA
ncbi:MAG: hypothetical protein Q4D53_06095 [Leptotrichiaceae bacterium]|nr:hypothetical protein [Leptotrichiaceae bacterium]